MLSLPHLKLLFWDPERCFLEHSVHDKRNRSPSRDIRDIFITATPEHKSDAHTNSRFRYIRKHGVLGEEPMLNAARVKGTRECGCQGELLSVTCVKSRKDQEKQKRGTSDTKTLLNSEA